MRPFLRKLKWSYVTRREGSRLPRSCAARRRFISSDSWAFTCFLPSLGFFRAYALIVFTRNVYSSNGSEYAAWPS